MIRLAVRIAPLVRSITERRYLLGAVLGWVLVVYLATGTATTAGIPPVAAGGAGSSTPQPAPPLALGAFAAPPFDTTPPPPTVFEPIGPIDFAPPPRPPAPTELQCPYPVPQAQSPGASPGVILSFLSPLLAPGGPFASYALPTLGGIGPLVPVITPLLVVSQPVLNAITPDMSTVITDLVQLETEAGLDGPQGQRYAQQFEPYWMQLLTSLQPAEQAFTSSTAGQCVILFENALAQLSQKEAVTLPPLPVLPAGVPPGSASSAAVGAGVLSLSPSAMGQVVLAWSSGVPGDLGQLDQSLGQLRKKGSAAVVELADIPPPGAATGGSGFADFVARAVHGLPAATAIQIDAPASASLAGAVADAVHGLAAADAARAPGQLIGLGLPDTLAGGGGPAFWSALRPAMRGYQADLVDFVSAHLTPDHPSSLPAALAEAAGAARTLRAQWSADGGVPAGIPLLGSVDLVGAAASPGAVAAEVRAYERALAGLGVGMLGIG